MRIACSPSNYEVLCPTSDCEGRLEFRSKTHTDMYYPNYDRNHATEMFYCSKCKNTYCREFQWQRMQELPKS
jgi:uncharacterized protein with PIN domain